MVRLHAANFIYQCVQFFSWQTEANCFFRWRKYFANPFISYGRMVYESIYNIWWCRVQYSMDFHGIICMVFITVHHILHNMHKEKPWKKRISEFTMCFVVHEKTWWTLHAPRSCCGRIGIEACGRRDGKASESSNGDATTAAQGVVSVGWSAGDLPCDYIRCCMREME